MPGMYTNVCPSRRKKQIELDRKETMEGGRHAITFVCNECKDNDRAPVFAFRLVGGLIQEVRIEDLPDLSPTKSTAKAARGRQGTNTRRRRSSKTNPSEASDRRQPNQSHQALRKRKFNNNIVHISQICKK